MLDRPQLQRDLRAVEADLSQAQQRLAGWLARGDPEPATHLQAVVDSHAQLRQLLLTRLSSPVSHVQ